MGSEFLKIKVEDVTPHLSGEVTGVSKHLMGSVMPIGERLKASCSVVYDATPMPMYTECEYIESTGTQWIDTDYAFKDDFIWEIDFEGIESNKTLFGGRTSSVRTALLYQLPEKVVGITACPIAGMNGQQTPFRLANLSTGRHCVRMSVKANKASIWVDGVQKYNNTSFNGAYISGTTQAVFADNFGNGDIQEHTSSKVYQLKMWQGGEIIRDFIPALDRNGVACLYDKVTEEFFYNQGSGEFLYKVKSNLPYQAQVQYIESTGVQYIDTKVYLTTALTNIEAKVEIGKSGTLFICGAGDISNTTAFSVAQSSTGELIVDIGDYYNYRVKTGVVLYNTGEHIIKIKDKNIYVDGTLCGISSGYINGTANTPLYLFANRDSSVKYSFKMYYFKNYDGDTLIRDLIPVIDNNGVACMYDKVSGEFFYNKGTGEFITGEEI